MDVTEWGVGMRRREEKMYWGKAIWRREGAIKCYLGNEDGKGEGTRRKSRRSGRKGIR